ELSRPGSRLLGPDEELARRVDDEGRNVVVQRTARPDGDVNEVESRKLRPGAVVDVVRAAPQDVAGVADDPRPARRAHRDARAALAGGIGIEPRSVPFPHAESARHGVAAEDPDVAVRADTDVLRFEGQAAQHRPDAVDALEDVKVAV